MNKYKYLIKNLGILTIAGFGTKLLNFFIVPLYTSVLSTTEYGTYDLLNTTISLLIPILTLNISEAIIRFCLDKNSDKTSIISIAFRYYFYGFILLVSFILLNYHFHWVRILATYPFVFVLLYTANSFVGIVIAYARGIDLISEVAISGVLNTIVTVGLNLLLLLVFKWGLFGYFWSVILGSFVQAIYLVIKTRLFSFIKLNVANRDLEKTMLNYCTPLITNSIAWWINSASDRYVITLFCGTNSNGIYSVAYKIPSLLTMLNTLFNQAWILSAVNEFDEKDESGFFSNVYNSLNALMTIVCSFLILLNKGLAYILFQNDFFEAWKYAPFLLISVVFGTTSGYMGGIFCTTKKTNTTATTVAIGAVLNIILNIVLVKTMGALGAAVATMLSYFIVWFIRLIAVKKMICLHIKLPRDLICYLLLLLQSVLYFVVLNNTLLYALQITLCISIIVMLKSVWFRFLVRMKNITRKV